MFDMQPDSTSSYGDFTVFYTISENSGDHHGQDSRTTIAVESSLPSNTADEASPNVLPQGPVEPAVEEPAPSGQRGKEPLSEPTKALEEQMLKSFIAMMERLCPERQQREGETTHSTASRPINSLPRTVFGMQNQNLCFGQAQPRLDNDDYEQIFPEDAYGEECGPNARVFKVYHQEATEYDNDMIGRSGDSSDVLLVFAGLFSAVLTTFVAQTSQALETDNSAISNSLLAEIVQLQRAQANGISVDGVERAITQTTPSSTDIWVNGLWFTSLTLSLATALFAVLTKQWLRQYMTATSGTVRDRCLIRHFRFMGMQRWHVVTIIGFLPILLHLSLFVFLTGLVVFLVPRSLPLACVVGGMEIIMFFLYLISNLLPVIHIQCPYRTPFSEILNLLNFQFWAALPFMKHSLSPLVDFIYTRLLGFPGQTQMTDLPIPDLVRLGEQEHEYVRQKSVAGTLSLEAIKWLMYTSSNPSVHSVALQAAGGLPPSQINILSTVRPASYSIYRDLSRECLAGMAKGRENEGGSAARRLERLCRSWSMFEHGRAAQYHSFGGDIFAAFRDCHHLKGMVASHSAALMGAADTSKPKLDDFILTYILPDSSNIKLSPCAWMNLFSFASPNVLKEDLYLSICHEILGGRSLEVPGPFESWDDETSLVTLGEALRRGSELVRLIFQQPKWDQTFKHSDPLPDSPQLYILLLLVHYLSWRWNNDPPQRNTIFDLIRKAIYLIDLHPKPTKDDCTAVFYHLQDRCLSTVSNTRESMESMVFSRLLRCCRDTAKTASQRFGLRVLSDKWQYLEPIAEISFMVDIDDTHMAYTSNIAQGLLKMALQHDVQAAYTSFMAVNALASTQCHRELVRTFVTGVVRHKKAAWDPRGSSNSFPLEQCLQYLHAPSNLYSACQLLGTIDNWDPTDSKEESEAVRQDILTLAKIQPDHPEWIPCRRRLHEIPENPTTSVKIAVDTLDRFFESRQWRKALPRKLNPITLFRSRLHDSADQDLENGEGSSHCVSGPLVDPNCRFPPAGQQGALKTEPGNDSCNHVRSENAAPEATQFSGMVLVPYASSVMM